MEPTEEELKERFAVLLATAQEKRFPNLSNAAVAERIGISRQLYFQYKEAQQLPTLPKFLRLAKHLKLNFTDLVKNY